MTASMNDAITAHIKDRYLTPASPELTDDTPLFTEGLIDSFGVLELITFLEDTFALSIDTAQHEIREFDSVSKIIELVHHLQNHAG